MAGPNFSLNGGQEPIQTACLLPAASKYMSPGLAWCIAWVARPALQEDLLAHRGYERPYLHRRLPVVHRCRY